ncbi:MAG: hypothetical protein ACM3JH_09750 [Acidithiobacillales bacterium]
MPTPARFLTALSSARPLAGLVPLLSVAVGLLVLIGSEVRAA